MSIGEMKLHLCSIFEVVIEIAQDSSPNVKGGRGCGKLSRNGTTCLADRPNNPSFDRHRYRRGSQKNWKAAIES